MSSSQKDIERPTVKLPQGTIVGITQEEHFPQPVQSFLGFPYALPPTGDHRFRPPRPVQESTRVFDASKYGPTSPGKPLFTAAPKLTYSEDCLTVNVFRQIPRETSRLLPVAVYVHGGAFNRGTSSTHKTASMVAWSEEPFIAVSFNYRLGSLGFLPSSVSQKEGLLNLGLKDQILLLEWVQENIHYFGGDKNEVTLFGLSAGAHSIGHHMMRHNEDHPGPFHRVIIESGSPTSRAVRAYDSPLHEEQFKDFLHEVKCPSNLSSSETFSFLRSLPLSAITDAQNTVFDKYNPSLQWAFQPVIDGEVILMQPIKAWRSGKYYKIPIMTGFNGNEGSLYVDKRMSKPEQFISFFKTLLPQLPPADIETISNDLYPDPLTSSDQTYHETRIPPEIGPQYKRIEAAYAHFAYVAPVRQTAHLASAVTDAPPAYLYHWAAIGSVNGGAQHGDNMRYETCDHRVTSRSTTQKELAGVLHAYITSFICHKGDPNALQGTYAQRPKWEAYKPEKPRTMIFGQGNEELVGGGTGTAAELIEDRWANEQCKFWWDRTEVTQQ